MNFHKNKLLKAGKTVVAKTRNHLAAFLMMLLLSIAINGCSGGDIPAVSSPSTPSGSTSNTIALSLSQNSVKSDSSDTSTITATVIKNNIPQSDVTVDFSTTAGLISAASAITNDSGEATITFKASPGDRANQIATVTASSGEISQSIPITVSGTTITLAADKTSLNVGEPTFLSIDLKDAGALSIYNATVTISTSNSNLDLPISTGTTSASGTLTIDVSGAAVGSCVITVTSMGASKTISFEILAASTAIAITKPATSPIIIQTNTGQIVEVSGPNGTNVTFVTSLGLWDNGLTTKTQDISGGIASATMTSTAVGTATIQVYATSAPGNTDTTFINVSPPATAANKVALSFSSSTVAASSDSITNSIKVYAKVITSASEPIANVPVTFNLSKTTGGGEYVNPPQAVTDSSGYATTTFYSGTSSSSGYGVDITATEQGSGSTNYDTRSVIIGGTAASISLAYSTKISSSSDNTYYTLPMSVLVSDSSGAPVANALVTLSAWPTRYRLGYNNDGTFVYVANPSGPYVGEYSMPNEDTNKNLVLDPGEDIGPCDNLTNCTAMVPDGKLTPASSAGGTVPASVTTIANGTAAFELTYLKSSAVWVQTEITATTKVLGTESRTALTSWLGFLETDAASLPHSPYGYR